MTPEQEIEKLKAEVEHWKEVNRRRFIEGLTAMMPGETGGQETWWQCSLCDGELRTASPKLDYSTFPHDFDCPLREEKP